MTKDGQLHSFDLEGFWMDVGQPKDFLSGTCLYLSSLTKKGSKELTSTSESYVHGGNVMIDPSAKIGNNCKIGPNVVIGPNCVIGDGVRLQRCVLLSNSKIKEHAWVKSTIVGWNSVVGRWARLENICVLGDDVTVGDEIYVNGGRYAYTTQSFHDTLQLTSLSVSSLTRPSRPTSIPLRSSCKDVVCFIPSTEFGKYVTFSLMRKEKKARLHTKRQKTIFTIGQGTSVTGRRTNVVYLFPDTTKWRCCCSYLGFLFFQHGEVRGSFTESVFYSDWTLCRLLFLFCLYRNVHLLLLDLLCSWFVVLDASVLFKGPLPTTKVVGTVHRLVLAGGFRILCLASSRRLLYSSYNTSKQMMANTTLPISSLDAQISVCRSSRRPFNIVGHSPGTFPLLESSVP